MRTAPSAAGGADELAHHAEAAVDRHGAGRRGDVAETMRTSVDLPTPLAPTSAARSPSPTVKLTSRSSSTPPGSRHPTWLTWIDPTVVRRYAGRAGRSAAAVSARRRTSRSGTPERGCRGDGVVVLDLDPAGGDLDADVLAVDVDRRLARAAAASARRVVARTPSVPVSAIITARDRCERGAVAQRVHGVGRPALLHHDRRDPRVVGAGGEQRGDRVGEHLAGDVVDVGLEQHAPAARCRRRRGRRSSVADDDLHDVGPAGRVGRAGAVADGVDRHRRQRRRSASASAVISATPVGVASSIVVSMPTIGAPRRASSRRHGRRRVRQLAVGACAPCRGRRRSALQTMRVDAERRRARRRRRRRRRSRRARRPRGTRRRRGRCRGSRPRPRRAREHRAAPGRARGRGGRRRSISVDARRGRTVHVIVRRGRGRRGRGGRVDGDVGPRARRRRSAARARTSARSRRRRAPPSVAATASAVGAGVDSAPSIMSPATPAKQWNQATRAPVIAAQHPAPPAHGRAEAVVDADDGDAAGARGVHRQQRGDAVERRRRSRRSSARRRPARR